ncbi:unnamed protein product [Porites lobata]|uniref:Uncharacterized protein n=1 Tax=Porites lobata TaxID=104759 RepID=A0ABN8MZU8_9CNID|nr:unnamed protein product [Porites lobata]
MMTHKTAPVNCHNHYTDGPMLPVSKVLQEILASNNGIHER